MRIQKWIIFQLLEIIFPMIFIVGTVLLILNVMGFFMVLNKPTLNNVTIFGAGDVSITPEEFFTLYETPYSDPELFATSMTVAVSNVILHYWDIQGAAKYRIKIPIYENWVLYSLYSLLPDEEMKLHEFCDFGKAIERGVGYCSQVSMILDSVLDSKGIESNILEFPWKHVVVTSRFEENGQETWWVLDPDYGVTIPLDIQTIQEDPEVIRPYYRDAGYPEAQIDNVVIALSGEYERHDSVEDYFDPGRCDLERMSYKVKWFLPLAFMLAGGYPFIRRRFVDAQPPENPGKDCRNS